MTECWAWGGRTAGHRWVGAGVGASTGAAGASPAVVFLAAAEAVEAGNAGIMDSETGGGQ